MIRLISVHLESFPGSWNKHNINPNPRFDHNYKLRLWFQYGEDQSAAGFLDDWCGYRFPEIKTLYLVSSYLISKELCSKFDNFFENIYLFKLQVLFLLQPEANKSPELMQLYSKIIKRVQKQVIIYRFDLSSEDISWLFSKII